jgi:hypothetical protein
MYGVCLSGGGTFSASTIPADGGDYTSAGADFPNDSQLFLLDSAGQAVYSNNDPLDSGGARIFNDSIFLGSGVLGPASTNPIAGWSNEGGFNGGGGPYTIALTGTVSCLTAAGFYAPIDNDRVNVAKAGQTVPVKWRLTDQDGLAVSDPSTFVSITSQAAGGTCGGLPSDAVETYSGDSGLQYLGDGNWQFNWKTPKSYAGQCRTMTLTLDDGTTKQADFQFK